MRGMTKRLLSIILMITILPIQLLGMDVIAADTTGSLLHSGGEGLLRYLDIIKEDVPYEKAVTRAELAQVAARVSAVPTYYGEELFFHDVPKEHPAYGDVAGLVRTGVIAGDGNGFYRPDDTVTPLEICKVFSVILGYREVGNHVSFLKIANQIGITDGIKFGESVTWTQMLLIAYRTLESEMFEVVGFDSNEAIYGVQEGFLAIERYHGLVKNSGLVEGAAGTTLIRANSTVADGEIIIGDRFYRYDDPTLLGKRVIFYIAAKDGESIRPDIAYLYVDEARTAVLTINDKDIVGKDGDVFNYYQNDKKKTVRLSSVPDVIINGVAHASYQPEDLKPAAGNVTLIDNNKDGVYDVLLVESYTYMMVSKVDKEKGILYGKYPVGSRIGGSDEDVQYTVWMQVGQGYLHHLVENDVIAAKVTQNISGTKRAEVWLLGKGYSGAVESIKENQITIGGTQYTVTDATAMDRELRLGEHVTVYEHDGRCAAIIHAENDGYRFGYLVAATNKGGSFSGRLSVKIAESGQGIIELDAQNKVLIDEIPFKNTDEMLSRLKTAAGRKTLAAELAETEKQQMQEGDRMWPYSQPIRFRINSDGLLTHLDTMLKEVEEIEDSLEPYSSDGGTYFAETNPGFWNSYSYNFFKGDKLLFTVSDMNNVIFPPLADRDDEAWYGDTMINLGTYKVEGYSVDPETKIARYAVVYNDIPTEVREDLYPYVITDSVKVLSEEGEVVRRLTLSGRGGTTTEYQVADNVPDTDLILGDIIRIQTDLKGKIAIVSPFYAISKGDGEPTGRVVTQGKDYGNNYSYRHRAAYGTVLNYANNIISHTTSVPSDVGGVSNLMNQHNYYVTNSTVFFVYDVKNGEVEISKGSVKDLTPYSLDPNQGQRAVMVTYQGRLDYVCIINEK